LNKRFQTKAILLSAGIGSVVAVAYSAAFYILMKDNYEILVDLSPMTESAKQLLHQELRQTVLLLVLGTLVFLLGTVTLALFVSHQAAGALYRMKTVFEQVAGGEFSKRIALRPGDDFKDVADAANRAIEALESRTRGSGAQ
jgi:methyl-accepting chemotaxis protein